MAAVRNFFALILQVRGVVYLLVASFTFANLLACFSAAPHLQHRRQQLVRALGQ